MCNVSNQVCGRKEDKINHPWRPFPSGRVSESQAAAIRWATVACCIYLSSTYDPELVHTTLCLIAVTFAHDELGGGNNVVGKALCTAAAYVCFEVGVTTIIGTFYHCYVRKNSQGTAFSFAGVDRQFTGRMDFVSATAVIISGILVVTEIHVQDFPDVDGDKTVGRMTLPIYAPELSRFLTLFVTAAWSIFLSWFWRVGPISTSLFTSFGIYVGLHCYCRRTLEADRKLYRIFNVRILTPLALKTSFLTYGRPRFGSWPRTYFLCMLERPFWRSDDINWLIYTTRVTTYHVISCTSGA
jgi:4-hydroxybenzoate polyprenyltransferase